jgi:hypothetical protein
MVLKIDPNDDNAHNFLEMANPINHRNLRNVNAGNVRNLQNAYQNQKEFVSRMQNKDEQTTRR